MAGAEVRGVVDGSPVVAGNLYFAAEHPMSKSTLTGSGRRGDSAALHLPLPGQPRSAAGEPRQFRALVGVAPPGQMRRGFLYYLERERAQPYRPLLHYNNGSEIGCEYWALRAAGKTEAAETFRRQQQQLWLDTIEQFGQALVQQRHVVVDSFAHDYEWDDENLVWQFHEGYPDGFRPAQQLAEKFGSHVGVWLSPSGGYPCKESRLASRAQARIRDLSQRIDVGRPTLLRARSRRLRGADRALWCQLLQVRWLRRGKQPAGRDGLRERRRSTARPDRGAPQEEARRVHQSEHGELAFTVLAAVLRLDLASRC